MSSLSNINKFWEFKNSTDSESELILYGQIASNRPWWDESEMVVQNEFISDLNNQQGRNIRLRINSVGGDVFAAHTMLTNLKLYKEKYNATIISQIDGLAASAATILMSGGDIIKGPVYANVMFHDPTMLLQGWYDGEDIQKAYNAWNSIKDSIINAYSLRFNMSKEEIIKLMKAETWLTGEQAKEKGFFDEIMFEKASNKEVELELSNDNKYLFVAGVKHDLSSFKNRPNIPNLVTTQPSIQVNNVAVNNKPNNQGGKSMEIKTVEELRNAYPTLVNQVIESAKVESVKNERERIKAIDQISNTLDPQLVENAKYGENPMNAQDLAFQALLKDQKKGSEYLNSVQEDIKNSGVNKVESSPNQPNDVKDEAAEKETINSMAAGANQRREQ
jgi:ATP-dependent protease ClpP protease subunit